MKEEWLYYQFSKVDVSDVRLQKRAVDIAIGCAEHPEESLAGRFDDWADLKATYRFFSHPKITHQVLQQPHYHGVVEDTGANGVASRELGERWRSHQ